jgi:WD40 repeat protein
MNATTSPPADRPFVGVTPFSEDQAGYFFGRDLDKAILESNLIAARLVVLYGPSGCGKSSLIDAGVGHHINRVEGPRDLEERGDPEFVVVSFRNWRDDPARGLLAAVRSVVERVRGRPVEPPPAESSLADALGHWAATLGGTLLLALDQFEEYFLYHGRSVAEGTFAHALAEVVTRPGLRANVLLALREDSLAQLDAFEGAIPNLLGNTLRLDPLDRDRGREAIVGPIARFNEVHGGAHGPVDRPEEDLIEAVLDEAKAGAIPLETAGRGRLDRSEDTDPDERPIEAAYLQLVMDRLWTEEARSAPRTLRFDTYRDLGRAEGIVGHHLDSVLSRLGWRDRRRAERLLTYLVTPSGSKIALEPAYIAGNTGDDDARVASILHRLSQPDFRVIRKVDDADRFEVFHDVLARVIVEDYVPRVRRRRLQGWITFYALGMILGVALAAVAGWQWWEARNQTRVATSRQLAVQALFDRDKRLDRALLLAAEAARQADTFEARNSLFETLQARPGLLAFLGPAEGSVTCVAFAPGGKLLAAGHGRIDGKSGVGLWDAEGRRPLAEPLPVNDGEVTSVAFSPDGKTLVAGYRNSLVRWDVATRKPLGGALTVDEGHVTAVAFSPDGKTLLAGYADRAAGGGVKLWDVAESQPTDSLVVVEGRITSMAFSPDGVTLAAGFRDVGNVGGVVRWTWDAARSQKGKALYAAEGDVTSLAFSRDGKTLALGCAIPGSGRGGVEKWDLTEPEPKGQPLVSSEGEVTSVAFSPDGGTLAAAYAGGVRLWDVVGEWQRLGSPLPVGEGGVTSVAFSPDGRTLSAAYGGLGGGGVGGVGLWDVVARRRLETPQAVAKGHVSSVAFSPDGKALAVSYGGSSTSGVERWDLAGRRPLNAPLPVAEGGVTGVAISPDGKTLAAGYESGSGVGGVGFWDAVSQQPQGKPLTVGEGPVTAVAFHPDGRSLAVGYTTQRDDGADSGRVARWVWDAAVWKPRDAPLAIPEGGVSGVALSPDGKILAVGHGHAVIDDRSSGVVLWDATSAQRLGEALYVAEGEVTSVAFSPDGRALAAGYGRASGEGVVVWDVAARRRLWPTLSVAQGGVNVVGVQPRRRDADHRHGQGSAGTSDVPGGPGAGGGLPDRQSQSLAGGVARGDGAR